MWADGLTDVSHLTQKAFSILGTCGKILAALQSNCHAPVEETVRVRVHCDSAAVGTTAVSSPCCPK